MTMTIPDDRQGNSEGATCPECGSSRRIAVFALMWSMQTPEGGDTTHPDVPWHGEEWQDTSAARCTSCGWSGQVWELGMPHDAVDE